MLVRRLVVVVVCWVMMITMMRRRMIMREARECRVDRVILIICCVAITS